MPASHDDTYVRTEFLERLAHELRGPAGVTLSALDEIERSFGGGAEALRSQFAMARRGVSRVVRAADRLQRAAQLERGDTQFEMTATDVRGLAEAAAKNAHALEARRKVELAVSSGPEACVAEVDAPWVQSAIAEIVGNAIRHARAKVSIDTRTVDGEVRITVRDDGPGFASPPSIERFEAPASRSGLGLSVPLVHDVFRSHRGGVDFSQPVAEPGGYNGGSVVLRLPLGRDERGGAT